MHKIKTRTSIILISVVGCLAIRTNPVVHAAREPDTGHVIVYSRAPLGSKLALQQTKCMDAENPGIRLTISWHTMAALALATIEPHEQVFPPALLAAPGWLCATAC